MPRRAATWRNARQSRVRCRCTSTSSTCSRCCCNCSASATDKTSACCGNHASPGLAAGAFAFQAEFYFCEKDSSLAFMTSPLIRPATEADLPFVTEIYEHAVRYGTATFELDPPDLTEMTRRFRALM